MLRILLCIFAYHPIWCNVHFISSKQNLNLFCISFRRKKERIFSSTL